MRIELAYEFDKYFNRSHMNPGAVGNLNTPFGVLPLPLNNRDETGSPALAATEDKTITRSDVLSTMVGFDYPLLGARLGYTGEISLYQFSIL